MSLLMRRDEEIVLSSSFDGVITMSAKPMEGVRVVRVLTWFETQNATDSTITSKDGQFTLPVVTRKLGLSKFGEFVVSQKILVQYEGKEHPIWSKAKWEKGIYGELGDKPENFHCELENEFKLIDAG